MDLFVKMHTGKTIVIKVDPEGKVDDIKYEIERKTQICPDKQRLLFAGKQLSIGQSLKFYGISEENTIHCLKRLRGC